MHVFSRASSEGFLNSEIKNDLCEPDFLRRSARATTIKAIRGMVAI